MADQDKELDEILAKLKSAGIGVSVMQGWDVAKLLSEVTREDNNQFPPELTAKAAGMRDAFFQEYEVVVKALAVKHGIDLLDGNLEIAIDMVELAKAGKSQGEPAA